MSQRRSSASLVDAEPKGDAALPRRRIHPAPVLALAQLADASLLADLAAQVVELRAVDVADSGDVDLVDLRRVQRERPLDADTERVLAHGEGLPHARTLPLDHDPLEDLDPLAVALDHLEVHAHRIARLEAGHVAQLAAFEVLDDRAHGKKGPGGPRNGSGSRLVRWRIAERWSGRQSSRS